MPGADLIVRGWKARLYPTQEQAERLNQWAGSLRFLWNRLLEREQAEYRATGRFLWRRELQPIAVGMKREAGTEWLADLPAHAVIDAAARMDVALRRMVAERKAGRRWGFPRAKKKFVRETGIYCVGQMTTISIREARLPKLGRIKLRGGSVPKGRLLAARVARDGDRWMLSAQFECARPAPLPPSDLVVGVDLGVSTLVTAFDGTAFEEEEAPRPLRRALKRLRRAQRRLSRRKKGSARRRAQARRVAAIHRRVRNLRTDFLHKLSHRLTAKAGVVKVETLNVAGMIRNRRLALSISDAGLAGLVGMLAYKADWRGRVVEKIDPWFPSSQLCACCGTRNTAMRELSRRMFSCAACGHTEGRDRNAARNIRRYAEGGESGFREGPKVRGDCVSPRRAGAAVGEARIRADVG